MKLKEVMTSMDYEKLYKAYYLQVYSYTISLAKNREIAEEITQTHSIRLFLQHHNSKVSQMN